MSLNVIDTDVNVCDVCVTYCEIVEYKTSTLKISILSSESRAEASVAYWDAQVRTWCYFYTKRNLEIKPGMHKNSNVNKDVFQNDRDHVLGVAMKVLDAPIMGVKNQNFTAKINKAN